MADKKDLNKRERQILDFLRKEIANKGYPPTVREICAAVGIKSTSTAHKDMNSLVRKGYLKKDPSKPRALILVQTDEEKASTRKKAEPAPVIKEREDIIDIPIVGRVAAGMPITAEENLEGTLPVPAQYVKGTCFMLKVKGESMINVGIMDGDMILVQQQGTANNGDIVVAMVDGFESEATVKTFYKEDGHIRLQPENDNMSPIIVKTVSIQGKVRGVFRYLS
ncbi:MAG: transcriptional repressor LexA [Lachnospiraceae bacterium]|nr:transcriptional repressor LexA [Lachnospiraceae bacterium]